MTKFSPMAFVKSAAPVVKSRAIKSEVPDNEEAYEVCGPTITDMQVDEEPADDIDEELDQSAELDPAKVGTTFLLTRRMRSSDLRNGPRRRAPALDRAPPSSHDRPRGSRLVAPAAAVGATR